MRIDIRKETYKITEIKFADPNEYSCTALKIDGKYVELFNNDYNETSYVKLDNIPNLIKALKKVCEIKNIDLGE